MSSIQITRIRDWAEFEHFIGTWAPGHRKAEMARTGRPTVSRFLYRGQANSTWRLDTTLERTLGSSCPLGRYYQFIAEARPQIEAFTDHKWPIPELDVEKLSRISISEIEGRLPCYEFLAYLRHHGFPSPLLDWTRSPYIAAFFAFIEKPGSDKVSIYAFWEDPMEKKSWSIDGSAIHLLGPSVRTHRRHFLQQCEYTICIERIGEDDSFVSHEKHFARNLPNQEYLWRLDLSADMRHEVLRHLDLHNINAFSLCSSEDSLVRTLATRIVELRDSVT